MVNEVDEGLVKRRLSIFIDFEWCSLPDLE